jgi:hypothetical protein
MNNNWYKTLPVAITVTDLDGKIVEMNDKSASTFAKYGGYELVGKQLDNCHNPRSREIIAKLVSDDKTNVYTIEKDGIRKLIYQSPWYIDNKPAGLVELSIVLPEEMPHFKR